jgi:hypothetical protein
VHRIGPASLTHRVVYIVAAEQFFFHLPSKRTADLRVGPVVGQRLMKSLRYYGETAYGVDNVAGSLLHEQWIVRVTAIPAGGAGDRAQSESAART